MVTRSRGPFPCFDSPTDVLGTKGLLFVLRAASIRADNYIVNQESAVWHFGSRCAYTDAQAIYLALDWRID